MVKKAIARHHKSSMLWQMNRIWENYQASPITWFHFMICNSVENQIGKLLMQQASIQLLFSVIALQCYTHIFCLLFAYLLKWLCIAYFCFLLLRHCFWCNKPSIQLLFSVSVRDTAEWSWVIFKCFSSQRASSILRVSLHLWQMHAVASPETAGKCFERIFS